MDIDLVKDLSFQLKALTYQCFPRTLRRPGVDAFLDKTVRVTEALVRTPQVRAQDLAQELGMDRNQIKLAYKLIQGSSEAADRLSSSVNGDYLKIVNHYFNQKMYVVVFFVGLSCPSRCVFCPNVSEDEAGNRQLRTYPVSKSQCLSADDMAGIFNDIAAIQSAGNFVLTKISGGLEPLTDPGTMAVIIEQARRHGIHLKLFTNGLLLDSPARRALALGVDDIRISLSAMDEERFGEVMFGKDVRRREKFALGRVLANIAALVTERNQQGLETKIGINSVVLEENYSEMETFIRQARALGVDYIDFKPNYFEPYSPEASQAIEDVARAHGRGDDELGIYFAKSLFRENLFWAHRDGICHPHKQGLFKMFISPHGSCSPVHHGAFPSADSAGMALQCGTLGKDRSFLDIVDQLPSMPELPQSRLNPFEHMLALEIQREEADRAWGIDYAYSPYHAAAAKEIPADLWVNSAFRHMAGLDI